MWGGGGGGVKCDRPASLGEQQHSQSLHDTDTSWEGR